MNKTEKMLVGEGTFAVLLMVFSLGIGYLSYQIAGFSSINSAGAFPLGVSLIMLLSSAAILLDLRKKSRPDSRGWITAFKQFSATHFPKRTLVFLALAIVYLGAIQWASFYLSTFAFLVASIVYLRNGRVASAGVIAAGLLLIIYLLFTLAFSVYLP